jgi:hypothetical protein
MECEDATENRFLRGLNKEIYDILVHETYTFLPQLLKLACTAENETLLALHTCNEESFQQRSFLLFLCMVLTICRKLGPSPTWEMSCHVHRWITKKTSFFCHHSLRRLM